MVGTTSYSDFQIILIHHLRNQPPHPTAVIPSPAPPSQPADSPSPSQTTRTPLPSTSRPRPNNNPHQTPAAALATHPAILKSVPRKQWRPQCISYILREYGGARLTQIISRYCYHHEMREPEMRRSVETFVARALRSAREEGERRKAGAPQQQLGESSAAGAERMEVMVAAGIGGSGVRGLGLQFEDRLSLSPPRTFSVSPNRSPAPVRRPTLVAPPLQMQRNQQQQQYRRPLFPAPHQPQPYPGPDRRPPVPVRAPAPDQYSTQVSSIAAQLQQQLPALQSVQFTFAYPAAAPSPVGDRAQPAAAGPAPVLFDAEDWERQHAIPEECLLPQQRRG